MVQGVRKKVLVTGASGLIGRAVTERLLLSNLYDVKVQVRNPSDARARTGDVIDFTKVSMEGADFTRVGDREMRLLAKGCHAIIHAAGLVHRPDAQYQEYEVMNVRATQLLAEAAASGGVHTFIFLSSSAVYGTGPFENVEENAPLKGITPYAVSKMTSEQFLHRVQGIPRIIILRPSLVFGEGDRGNMLNLINQVKSGKYAHIGGGGAEKSVIYSKDLALASELCLDRIPEGLHVFNIANPAPVSVKQLTEEIAQALGMPRNLKSVPTGLAKFGAQMAQIFMREKSPVTAEQLDKITTTTTLSSQRLVMMTQFAPRYSLATALQAEIAWAKENQLLS